MIHLHQPMLLMEETAQTLGFEKEIQTNLRMTNETFVSLCRTNVRGRVTEIQGTKLCFSFSIISRASPFI